jgi:hypothetical protein
MKNIYLLTILVLITISASFAQDEVLEKAKSGSFYLGINAGLPLSTSSDVASFNIGGDVAYLFELVDNLELGALVGYTHYIGDGTYFYENNGNIIIVDYKDASFIPLAATARYYFGDHKFFGGLDLGIGINVSGDADTGFYARPKFGFDFGTVALIASYQSISGGTNYNNFNDGNYNNNVVKTSGFNSFNIGVEFGF